MICKQCGAEVEGEFCTECGAKLEKEETAESAPKAAEPVKTESAPNAAQPANADGGKKKSSAGLIAAICGVVVFCVLVLVLAITHKPTVNLNKYITVEFEGYEGLGRAKVTFDYDKMTEDFEGKIKVNTKKLTKEEKKLLKSYEVDELDLGLAALEASVNYKMDPNRELSNGDKVTLTWDMDDEEIMDVLKVKLKHKEKEYKVSGLEKIDKFDPFEYVEPQYSGTAPNGQVSFKKDSTEEMVAYLDFKADKTSGLSNGDKIKVTVSMNMSEDKFAEKFGELPIAKEMEYTVEGIPAYISSASEIDEDTMAKMKKQAEDTFTATTVNWQSEATVSSMDYIGNYFLTAKNENAYGFNNKIYLVYKITVTETMTDYKTSDVVSQDEEYYYYVAYSNIMNIPGDGIFVDTANYEKARDSFKVDTEVVKSTGWWTDYFSFNYTGYRTVDEIYKIAIVTNIENYNSENNIVQ